MTSGKKFTLLALLGFSTLSSLPALAGPGPGPGPRVAIDSVKVTLTQGTNMAIALSPDKQTIAMDLQGTIWTLPASGGTAKPLTDALGDCRQPVWSPDGSMIAFQAFWDGNFHIWTVDKKGGTPRQLTFGSYDDREPSWSPDGKSLLFSSDRSGNYDIWKLDIATGQVKQLTNDPANDYYPAFSADGNKVAYVSERTSAPGIYIKEGDKAEQLFVTNNGKFFSPVWHPTQPMIIFNSSLQGNSALEIAQLGGGEWETLSDPKEDVFPFKVSWISPTDYLYTSDGQIKRKKLGDTKSTPVPFQINLNVGRHKYAPKAREFNSAAPLAVKGIRGPVVSPDGRKIVFTALGDLWVLETGKVEPKALTNDASIEIDAIWSPNGKQLAYVSDRNGNMDLWIRDLETGKDKMVLDAPDNITLPSWSADGSRLAFHEKEPHSFGRSTLKYINLATSQVTSLYGPVFDASQASWSPDGKYVVASALVPYSTRYREGVSKFLVINTEDKSFEFITPINERTLSTRGKNGPYWSPDGKMFAFCMDSFLWTVPVDSKGKLLAAPRRLTNELAENPSWTADSKSIVYIAIDSLKKVSVVDGSVETIPLQLTYKPKQPTGQVVVHAGKVFDGRSAEYKTNVDIIIENNRIKEIVPHKAGRPGQLIDASRQTVIPGLVEMHTHQSASAGEQAGRLWLAYGVTTTREPGGEAYDVIERKEAYTSGRRKGPRVFYTGGILDGSRIYYGMNVGNLAGGQLDFELNKAARLGYDMIKTYVRMPDAMQQRVTAFAHSQGIPVSSHEIYPSIGYGVDNVEHMGATSRRGYSPKLTTLNKSYQDVVELISKSGMVSTPTASLHGGLPLLVQNDPTFFDNRQFKAFYTPELVASMKAQAEMRNKIMPGYLTTFGNIQTTMKEILAAGGRLTPGTDSPIIAPGISYYAELLSWVDGGITPFETLRAATLWSAEALGVSKDLGTLESGKLADLVIVDGDPLKNIKDVINVRTVIKNGEVFGIEELLKN